MSKFLAAVEGNLKAKGQVFHGFYDATNIIETRIMKDYGALFLNPRTDVVLPSRVRFNTQQDHDNFVSRIKVKEGTFNNTVYKLQEAAMDSLKRVEGKVGAIKLKSANSASRTMALVQKFWDDEVIASATYWRGKKNSKGVAFTEADCSFLSNIANSGDAQVKRVLELEAAGFSFHSDRQRTITVLVAIPKASQHLSYLAVDVDGYKDDKIRAALAEEGWFQTVASDRPHFTYLGLRANDLTARGLKLEPFEKRDFWIPDM